MASYVMVKIAKENESEYPDAAVILRRDRYMDDPSVSSKPNDSA